MPRRLEPQDLYDIRLIDDPQITPDGLRIAYVVVEMDRKSYEYHRSLWVVETKTGAPRRYTGGDNDTAPRWSPDGRSLAFVRAPAAEVKPKNEEERDRGVGKPQLWMIPADGGGSAPAHLGTVRRARAGLVAGRRLHPLHSGGR